MVDPPVDPPVDAPTRCEAMSHPLELIEAIRREVERDYPPERYEFRIERAIPGTRFFPDILVTSKSGEMVCAVEIGYTRPEKLTYYRDEVGIHDVRWYDKQRRLHPGWQRMPIQVVCEVSGVEPDTVAAYFLERRIECENCRCERTCSECDAAGWCEMAAQPVRAVLLTDYRRFWLPIYCDACDTVSCGDRADVLWILDDLVHLSRSAFGREYGPRTMMSWPRAVTYIRELYELQISCIRDGHFIDEEASLAEGIRHGVSQHLTVHSVTLAEPSDPGLPIHTDDGAEHHRDARAPDDG